LVAGVDEEAEMLPELDVAVVVVAIGDIKREAVGRDRPQPPCRQRRWQERNSREAPDVATGPARARVYRNAAIHPAVPPPRTKI
jgi:hypothetical protein